jgi:hypothetical protein
MQAFDATRLGLQVNSGAEAAVRQSLRRIGLVALMPLQPDAAHPEPSDQLLHKLRRPRHAVPLAQLK